MKLIILGILTISLAINIVAADVNTTYKKEVDKKIDISKIKPIVQIKKIYIIPDYKEK